MYVRDVCEFISLLESFKYHLQVLKKRHYNRLHRRKYGKIIKRKIKRKCKRMEVNDENPVLLEFP